MLQLIPPTTPDYQDSFGQAIAITYHPPPISIVLTQQQTNYIVSLYHLFRHDPTFIANRVNELWGKQGIRMSPQDICDVLVQAQEQSGYVEGHPYMVYSNTYLETLVRHRWGLSQGVGGSGVDGKSDMVLARPRTRKRGSISLDFISHSAHANRRALFLWYGGKARLLGNLVCKESKAEIHSLFRRVEGPHTVERAQLRPDTVEILRMWESEALIPGTKEFYFAKIRALRDIIFEKLHGSATADEELAKLNPTVNEMSQVHQWLYVTADGQYAMHRPFKQPFFYKVLGRDGVTTLPPESSADNETSIDKKLQPQKLSKLPRRLHVRIASDMRFNPYSRPSRKVKKLLKEAMGTLLDSGSIVDDIQGTTHRAEAAQTPDMGNVATSEPSAPIEHANLAIRVVNRALSSHGSKGHALKSSECNEGFRRHDVGEALKGIEYTNLAIRVVDRGSCSVGKE